MRHRGKIGKIMVHRVGRDNQTKLKKDQAREVAARRVTDGVIPEVFLSKVVDDDHVRK